MLQKLVSHNIDVQRLIEKGYAVSFDSNYLVVRDIPYLDAQKQLKIGAIVTKLVFLNSVHVTQDNHQIFFAGSTPHGLDGKPVPQMGDSPTSLSLSEKCKDIVVQRQFSNKPKKEGKYKDFFEKIEVYVSFISGPAIELFPNATPLTFRQYENENTLSPFKFRDTLTSRAEITDLSKKFENEVVAIVGLGGTGSYVLDFLAKTPVKQIRLFDNDEFHVHNSFRSPGSTVENELNRPKTEIYQQRYTSFRDGIVGVKKFVDSSSKEDFTGVTFVFVCIDKGSSRNEIFDLLIELKIPFIDVGMGLKRKNGLLTGDLRTTYYSVEHAQKTKERKLSPISDNPDDIYKTNIQIAEVNAINACLAVLKYKQLREFYYIEEPLTHMILRLGDLKLIGEE